MPIVNAANALTAGGLAYSGLSYNRDNFSNSIQLRQSQVYQEKNYHIAWISAVREEVRDLMMNSVGVYSNDMIVTTIMLSITTGFIAQGEVQSTCPDPIAFAYYVSAVLSMINLGLSIYFAFKGMQVVFDESMRFLLAVVPDPQDKYDFDYMSQLTEKFERDFMQTFRVPLVGALLGGQCFGKASRAEEPQMETLAKGARAPRVTQMSKKADSCPRANKSCQPVQEATDAEWIGPSYYEILAQYRKLWEPCSVASHDAMAHGILNLIQGISFFLYGKLYSRGGRYGGLIMFLGVILVALLFSGGIDIFRDRARKTPEHDKHQHPCVQCLDTWLFRLRLSSRDILVRSLIALGPICFIVADLMDQQFIFGLAALFIAIFEAVHVFSVCMRRIPYVELIGAHIYGPKARDVEEAHGNQRDPPEIVLNELLVESKARSARTSLRNKEFCALGHIAGGLIWLGLSVWCFTNAGVQLHGDLGLQQKTPSLVSYPFALVENIPVAWPSPYFQPRSMACVPGSQQVLIANEFGVFKLPSSGGSLVPQPCLGLSQSIVDLAAGCSNQGNCWTLALMDDGAGGSRKAVNCSDESGTSNASELPFAAVRAQLIAVRMPGALVFALQGGKIVDLQTRVEVDIVQPDVQGTLRSMDIALSNTVTGTQEQLLLFRSPASQHLGPSVVETHMLGSAVPLPWQSWQLPTGLPSLRCGCALGNNMALAVLQDEAGAPQLVRLTLR